jgi:hypothetical protein
MAAEAVKILLRSPDGDVETLWADPADAPDAYTLDNVPWYAYGVSLGDVVEAHAVADGMLEMTRVLRKSGNRTLRVLLTVAMPAREWTAESRRLVDGIRERGAGIENMNKKLVAVTVPPAVDLLALAAYIDAQGFEFEYADPPFEALFPEADGGETGG